MKIALFVCVHTDQFENISVTFGAFVSQKIDFRRIILQYLFEDLGLTTN